MFFNVHYRYGTDNVGKCTLQAVDKEAAIAGFNVYARMDMDNPYHIPFEAEITKVIQLGKISSPKQKLAQKYGFIMGGIKGSLKSFNYAHTDMLLASGKNSVKLHNAIILAQSQFAKLQRDVADAFKLAGLNIKGAK